MLCHPQQTQSVEALGRSRSLCGQQSQSLQASQRCRSFPYKSGYNPRGLPLLSMGSHNGNNDNYEPHHTTGSDNSYPSERLLPRISPNTNTDYDELGTVASVGGSDVSNPSESPLPCNSPHAETNYDEPDNVATTVGSDDSTLSESLLPSSRPYANTDGNVAGVVAPSGSNPSEFVAVNIDSHDENNDDDQPHHGTRVTLLQGFFILTGLSLELLSAGFDQASSPLKPLYALVSLLLAVAALLTCTCELIHNGRKEAVASTNFGTLSDIFGLGLAVIQCLCSAVQYYFLHRHDNNPMKLSPVPLFCFVCLVVLKLKMN